MMSLFTLCLALSPQALTPKLDDLTALLQRPPVGEWVGRFATRRTAVHEPLQPDLRSYLSEHYPVRYDIVRDYRLKMLLAVQDEEYRQSEHVWLSSDALRMDFELLDASPAIAISVVAEDKGDSLRVQRIPGQPDYVSMALVGDKMQVATGSLWLWAREAQRLLHILRQGNPVRGGKGHDCWIVEADRLISTLPELRPGAPYEEAILTPPNEAVRPGGKVVILRSELVDAYEVRSTYYDAKGSILLESLLRWEASEPKGFLPSSVVVNSYVDGTKQVYCEENAALTRVSTRFDPRVFDVAMRPGSNVADFRNGATRNYTLGSESESDAEHDKEILRHAFLHMALLQTVGAREVPPDACFSAGISRYQQAGGLRAAADPVRLGNVSLGTASPAYVVIQNCSTQEQWLELAKKDCSCLSVEFGCPKLNPGESTWIRFVVQPSGLGEKSVNVSVRAKGHEESLGFQVEFEATSTALFVAPPFVNLGRLDFREDTSFDVNFWDTRSSKNVESFGVSMRDLGLSTHVEQAETTVDSLGTRHPLKVRCTNDGTADVYGFVSGQLSIEGHDTGASRSLEVVADLVPDGVDEWPDCLVLLERSAGGRRAVVFPEEVSVTSVVLDKDTGGGFSTPEARWNPDRNALEISIEPNILLSDSDLGIGMWSAHLASSVGWIDVRILVVP